MQALPIPDGALRHHIAVIGKTGSGKTFAAKAIAEHLVSTGRRVCVIDPTGVWWGLRSSADGRAPGLPVVIVGGEHGDLPITESAGLTLARWIAGGAPACVLDVSEMTGGERKRFVAEFCNELRRVNREPLHLFVDEADEMAPQNPMPDTRTCLGAVDGIVRRGRAKGLFTVLITQRPAVLHKNLLTQCETLIAMRLVGPQDRKAIDDWIRGQADPEAGRTVIESLSSLDVGEGWVWYPSGGHLERTRFPLISTFDSSRTPEFGDAVVTPAARAAIDLETIRTALAEMVAAASPAGPSAVTDMAAIDRARAEGRAEGVEEGRRQGAAEERARWQERIRESFGDVLATPAGSAPTNDPAPPAPTPVRHSRPAPPVSRSVERPKSGEAPGALVGGARKVVEALARVHPTRVTWQQAATLAGLKARGGHWNAARKALRDDGLVDEPDGMICLSPRGVEAAGVAAIAAGAMTPAELLAMWQDRLPNPARAMLAVLVDRFPSGATKDELGAALGLKPYGGHWNGGLAMLRNNALVEEAGGRLVPARAFLEAIGGGQ